MNIRVAQLGVPVLLMALAVTASAADATAVKAYSPKVAQVWTQRADRTALPSARMGLARTSEFWLAPLTANELDRVKPKAGLTLAGVHRNGVAESLARGEWIRSREGRSVYRTALRSPGAQGIRVHFRNFSVGSGKVWLHDGEPDGEVAGPYTSGGPFGDGDFWSDVVFGESVTIEYLPDSAAGENLTFEIAEISHMLNGVVPDKNPVSDSRPLLVAEPRGPAETLPGVDLLRAAASPEPRNATALSCNIDSSCHPQWAERAKSVARYLFETGDGSALCSGALVNTRNNSGKLYFLTADHCVSTEAEARSVQTFWFYETAQCNGPAPSTRNARTALGARYLASGGLAAGDYTLLELREVPPGVTFSGWTATDPAKGTAITGIHHPRGDYRRISFGSVSDPVPSRSRPENKFHTITWNRGVTEGGSSGSPVFNEDGLIVGMLSGGPRPADGQTECDLRPAFDWYGRLSAAYPALQSYLDDRQVGGQPQQPTSTGTSLTSNTPRQFSFGPVSNGTLFTGENAFRIDVPQGATRLEIQVRTRTPGADIDLFVRHGSPPFAGQSVQADYRSTGDSGDETLVITPSSSPGLQAGTYYIALALFTNDVIAEGSVMAVVTTAATTPPPQQGGGSTLTTGQPARWTLGPVAGGTLFGGANAYQINVPQGATRLEIQLATSTASVDVDLFVRHGQVPALGTDGRVVADRTSTGDTGNETIRIENPQSGVWYIALALITPNVQASGTITATVATPQEPAGGSPLTSGTPRTWTFAAVDSPTLFTGDNAFQVSVPQGATRLEVRLVTATRGVDMDLFVRFGQTPAVSGNSVQSDHSSESDSGDETVVITASGSPALRAGTYYIALASFTRGVRMEGTIVATVTAGGSGSPAVPATLLPGVSQPVAIAPVTSPALLAAPQFRITVPQGAARLRVQLRTATPGVDVDLFARFERPAEVSDGRPVADHSSAGDAGDENLSIDATTNPPLRAGTYIVSLAVFTADRAIEGTITAFVDTLQTAPPANATVLTSASPARFAYPAQPQTTLYTGTSGFRIDVPAGATSLTVRLSTATSGADLDLFVRHGADVDLRDGEVVADVYSEGPTGQETVTFTRTSTPALRPGTYYIGIAVVARDIEVSGTVTATVERAVAPPSAPTTALALEQPARWALAAVTSPTLFSGANAFRLEVANIGQLQLRLTTDTPGADVDLYVRYGSPPEVQNGRVVADFSAASLSGNEVVTISPGADSPLNTGTYYVALAVFTMNTPVQGSLLATTASGKHEQAGLLKSERVLLKPKLHPEAAQ